MNKEDARLLPLATYGITKGLFNVYVKPELTAGRAWAVMGLGILAYEYLAPPGQLLSEGADAYLESHPILTRAAIGLTALHLSNVLPERFDPIHQLTRFK